MKAPPQRLPERSTFPATRPRLWRVLEGQSGLGSRRPGGSAAPEPATVAHPPPGGVSAPSSTTRAAARLRLLMSPAIQPSLKWDAENVSGSRSICPSGLRTTASGALDRTARRKAAASGLARTASRTSRSACLINDATLPHKEGISLRKGTLTLPAGPEAA